MLEWGCHLGCGLAQEASLVKTCVIAAVRQNTGGGGKILQICEVMWGKPGASLSQSQAILSQLCPGSQVKIQLFPSCSVPEPYLLENIFSIVNPLFCYKLWGFIVMCVGCVWFFDTHSHFNWLLNVHYSSNSRFLSLVTLSLILSLIPTVCPCIHVRDCDSLFVHLCPLLPLSSWFRPSGLFLLSHQAQGTPAATTADI